MAQARGSSRGREKRGVDRGVKSRILALGGRAVAKRVRALRAAQAEQEAHLGHRKQRQLVEAQQDEPEKGGSSSTLTPM